MKTDHSPMSTAADHFSKVPEVTLGFWFIKILATTLGETGGDAFSMSLNWGYAVSSVLFTVLFLALVSAQIAARRFVPPLYSPRRQPARQWPILPIVRSASAIPADHCYCLRASSAR